MNSSLLSLLVTYYHPYPIPIQLYNMVQELLISMCFSFVKKNGFTPTSVDGEMRVFEEIENFLLFWATV